MIKRKYYSVRGGKLPDNQKIDLKVLKRLFLISYRTLEEEGYFQNYFGIDCTDGYILGKLGSNINDVIFVNLKKDNLYPIEENIENYSEDDLFDIMEFLHDYCSEGKIKQYHQWNECGYHYSDFNDSKGQKHFRDLINPILSEYKDGFELSENGEILSAPDKGLSNLFLARVPTKDKSNIQEKIDLAIQKFRRHRSTLNDRKEAIRELADVLEFLRPQIKNSLNKSDEKDLFNIANNFGIRHHNQDQKNDYDKAIWYSWIFYYYLATLHAAIRIIEKNKTNYE